MISRPRPQRTVQPSPGSYHTTREQPGRRSPDAIRDELERLGVVSKKSGRISAQEILSNSISGVDQRRNEMTAQHA